MRRPTGVAIIGIGQWIAATVGVVLGIAVLLGWRGLEGSLGIDLFSGLGRWTALVLFVAAAVQALFAAQFWKLQNWARVLLVLVLLANALGDGIVIVFYFLAYPDFTIALSAIVKLAASIGIAWYLSRPSVREAFS